MRFKGITLNDPARDEQRFRERSLIAAVASVILLLVIALRLVYLQVFNYSHYTTLSHNNSVDIQPIAPTRGLIYDRQGVILAQNLPSYSLEIIQERVEDIDQTLADISELITVSEEDISRFKHYFKRKRRFEGVPLRYRLNEEEVARIAVNRHRLPGVEIVSRLSRQYPLGQLTAHTVGYVGRIDENELQRVDASNYSATTHIGKVGLEKYYEDTLHGRVGFQRVESNARGRILRVLDRTPPQPGKDLHLNLDIRLHQVAEQALAGERGALVAIDPRNGALLAMVSTPSYDPNLFVNGIRTRDYRALTESKDQPLFNRALTGQYPPGSTTKPFIGLAGLEVAQIKPQDKINCPGWYMLKGDERHYRDWKKEGHGHLDMNEAIVESCDVYFYDLSLNLGIDIISNFMQTFGFGQKTGIDIGGEVAGLMPSREWKREAHNQPWFPGETLITGIGQGFTLATPLQLSANTGALAMNGKRMTPMTVHSIEDPISGEVQTLDPKPLAKVRVVEQGNWNYIHKSMVEVIHGITGTARRINRRLPYSIAGKTGTSQVFGIKQDEEYVEEEIAKRLRDHALFVSYAPADDPQIAVAVVVENGGSGGATAAPIARRVMDQYLLGEVRYDP